MKKNRFRSEVFVTFVFFVGGDGKKERVFCLLFLKDDGREG